MTDLDDILGRIAVAAAELLTSPERDRVRECASHNCSWLFVDMSRNRSRRWCDMKVCGNRAKARRFSARHRE
jgi:predicted RNA-binding Zn ribbon-like protein